MKVYIYGPSGPDGRRLKKPVGWCGPGVGMSRATDVPRRKEVLQHSSCIGHLWYFMRFLFTLLRLGSLAPTLFLSSFALLISGTRQ